MEQPHKHNERITVFWPGGPYNFVLEFDRVEPVNAPDWEDWFVIHGVVVQPEGVQHHTMRGFYVHPVEGGYEMLPANRPISGPGL